MSAAEKLPPPDQEEEKLAEGTLIAHLLELRSRLLKAFAAVAVVFLGLAPFASRIFELVSAPLRAVLPGDMIVTGVAAPFLTPFKTTLFVALFLAMPVVLHQAWQFVAPALYRREKRLALPLLASSVVLFYAGLAFAYYVVFPIMFKFFVGTTPVGVEMMTDISSYVDFVLTMFLAFGIVFETPIATVLLVWSGLSTTQSLTAARPYVFLGAFVVGMLLATDVFSMTLMAIPMYLLYEGGLLLSRFLFPQSPATQDAES